MAIFLLIVSFVFVTFFYILTRKSNSFEHINLPPGPPKLPIIGNLHQMVGALPQYVFRDMAKKYGPIMHLQLGQISIITVSSPRLAAEVMKTNDLALASRPNILLTDIVFYGSSSLGFAPYGDYWRQMKKIVTVEVLNQNRVKSFSGLRQQEIAHFIDFIRLKCGKPVRISENLTKLSNNIVCKSLIGNNCKQQDVLIEILIEIVKLSSGFSIAELFPDLWFLSIISGMKLKLMKIHKSLDMILDDILEERRIKRQTRGTSKEDVLDVLLTIKERGGLEFPITYNNVKAILVELFVGGTDTSAVTIEWAMTEMMRNPEVMKKAQIEVREAFKDKNSIKETDLQDLVYLKLVIKETLRLHSTPLAVPRECREHCQIDGYDIPMKTKVIVNTLACATDPEYWDDAESFKPERFDKSSLDIYGKNYEFLPFGSGRRMCPGISFAMIIIEATLAHMLYYFDWKLPDGLRPNDFDMTENPGLVASKKVSLQIIPTLYSPSL